MHPSAEAVNKVRDSCGDHGNLIHLTYKGARHMTDAERLDWLDHDDARLEDVRYRMLNEEETIREAIDTLAVYNSIK